ncbi:hypothetical protein SS50377_22222 [Spironucleus salmonicida]|uniref:Uncharacterized protein n=1 Tax=Spironucleus salmonicida TaxID=348837 RepID=A0A9P8RZ42_9EUKA|nr:hypothetical protein SS50377_22222 [Spironucleus salmonicida]
MHLYYQTPFKLLLYILQYCILIKHYASTTHACLSTIYGNTWGSSTSGAHFSSRQLLKIEYTNSLRHSLCLYSTGKNTLPSATLYLGSQVNMYQQAQQYIIQVQQYILNILIGTTPNAYILLNSNQDITIYTIVLHTHQALCQYHSRLPQHYLWKYLGYQYQWYPVQQQPAMPNMKVKPLYTMPTASTQARSTKMWKAQASIRSVLFLINYDIATSLGPDHQLALSRHPDSHTLADLALAKLILRVVVTIQNSSIPMLLSQAAYRVRLQSIMFDRLCIMRVLKIKYKQSSAQPVLVLYRQEYPSQCTVHLGSQVNMYQQAQQYIIQVQQYILNILIGTTPNAYILLNSNQDITIYTIVLHCHQSLCQYHSRLPWCCLWNYLGYQYQWYPLQQQAGTTHRIYKQSSAQPVLVLYRQEYPSQCTVHLGSQVNIYQQAQQYIIQVQQQYTKYPYKHHSQCIYTTKLQLRYSYIYYSIVYSSSTIPVPLTPALVLSMELLGVQYQWCPLQQQIVIKDRIYKQSSAQPVLVLYRQEYPSQCTVHLGSQVNIYQQAQQYIIQIQQYILNILTSTTPNAYILLNSNQDITIYTIVLHCHQALSQYHSRLPWCCLWNYLGQQYQWYPLQQQAGTTHRIYKQSSAQPVLVLYRQEYPSQCTVHLGSQVNIYQQAQQYIIQIQQYILNILIGTTPNAYILLNSNQDITIYTIVLHCHQALRQYHSRLPWCYLWNYLGSSTSGAHFSSRQLLKIEYKQSSAQPVLVLYRQEYPSQCTVHLGSQVNIYQQAQQYIIQIQQYILNILIGTTPNAYILLNSIQVITIYTIVLHTHQALRQYHSCLPWCYLWNYLGYQYWWYPVQQQPAMPNMKVKPLYTMPTASTQARSTKMWKAQASIRSVLFLINYDIATSLGPDHQLALSRHPDSHTLADLALAKLILRVVVTIQNSSIPRLLSQAAYRVRLQSIMFDRLCIMRVLKIKYKQSSAQPVLALLVRIPFLVYCAPGLISEYILVSIVVYSINTIVYTKYPYKHHSQCIYTTKLHLSYYYIYYSIAYSSSTIPVPLTPALVLSMELLGVQYQWCPLQQQIVIKDKIQAVFGIACACITSENSLLSVLCTWAHK